MFKPIHSRRFLPFLLLLASLLFLPIRLATAQFKATLTTHGLVRLVYFLPNDRPARPERVAALRELMKETQEFYADEIQRHGYGRKTFSVETNNAGAPVVHRIDGKFPEAHYYESFTGYKVWTEVRAHFNDRDLQHIHFVAIDLSRESTHGGRSGGEGTISFYSQNEQKVVWRKAGLTEREEAYGGFVVISASGAVSEKVRLTAHELGHAFGLLHDFRGARDSDFLMSYGRQRRLSKCSAQWVSAHRFFNTQPIVWNAPTDIQLLSTRAYGRETISLRFNVTDPDGLHHAQLLLPEHATADISSEGVSVPRTMFDCKPLAGKSRRIATAVRRAVLIDRVTLQVMDVNGNITWATLPIELDAVVSAPNVLDINSDGIVNISDVTHIASQFNRRGKHPADVNEDRVVDIADLLLIAASLSSISRQEIERLVATDVEKWLTDAKRLGIENEFQQKGIVFLEHLLSEIARSSRPIKAVKAPLKAVFEAHTSVVNSVAFSPDGQTLVSASADNTLRLWDPHTAELKTLLIGHTDIVNRVALSPNGAMLASASPDTTVRLWDTRTGEQKTTLRAHSGVGYIGFYSVAFSPDGQTIAAGGDYSDPTIRLWDLHTSENRRTLTGHTQRIVSVAFSPNGRLLASGSADNTVRLWHPHNGTLKSTLRGHTQVVASVAFSPNGQTLASASWDGTIRLWNPQNGEKKKTLTGNTAWIQRIAFSPDGTRLASGSQQGRRIRFWDLQSGEYTDVPEDDARSVISVAFSPDGTQLASSRANATVQLWDVQMLLQLSGWGPQVLIVPSQRPPMYWVDAKAGTLHRLIADNVENLLPSVRNATRLAVDAPRSRLYWTTQTNENWGKIYGAPLKGTPRIEELRELYGVPLDLAVDPQRKHLYWIDALNRIQRSDLDAENIRNLARDLKAPKHLTLDVRRGTLYWTEQTSDQTSEIRSADLDGSNVQRVKALTSAPRGLTIDTVTGKLYLTTADGKVQRLNVDGSNFQRNLITGLDAPKAVSVDVAGRKIYWTAQNSIRRADLNGENIEDVVTGGGAPTGLVIGSMPPVAPAAPATVGIPPETTVLLVNYPNPFNPETWIPYQLSAPAAVTVNIYDMKGALIRRLTIGPQAAGYYTDRNRAAYWDGRNSIGEPVASGVYFYTLTAGEFTATRKLLIRK